MSEPKECNCGHAEGSHSKIGGGCERTHPFGETCHSFQPAMSEPKPGVPCTQCRKPVEEAREVYVTPMCYACLPPPEPLPIRPWGYDTEHGELGAAPPVEDVPRLPTLRAAALDFLGEELGKLKPEEWEARMPKIQAVIFNAASWIRELERLARPPVEDEGERGWRPIASAPEHETVLAYHTDDLFPVAAFRSGAYWMLEREGPEDTTDRRPGKHSQLYRTPTHWMPMPETPLSAPPEVEG